MTSVAVVGSANLDVVTTAPRRPAPGETLLGTGYVETPGGKGLNQAVAAGVVTTTAFVGKAGSDAAGDLIESHLRERSIDTLHLLRSDLPSGRAMIAVTPDGENSIIVVPLANNELTAIEVEAALRATAPSVVLVQLEVADEVIAATARWCAESGARLVLNPSPFRALPAEILALADPVIANLAEAAALLGERAPHHDVRELITALARICGSIVITAGADGVFFSHEGAVGHIEGQRVTVLDTTGAGDAFAGTLAAHLARGSSLADAAAAGNHIAGRLIQRARSDR